MCDSEGKSKIDMEPKLAITDIDNYTFSIHVTYGSESSVRLKSIDFIRSNIPKPNIESSNTCYFNFSTKCVEHFIFHTLVHM